MIQTHLLSLPVRLEIDLILRRSIGKSIQSNPFLKPWVNPQDMRHDIEARMDKFSRQKQIVTKIEFSHMMIAQVRQTVIDYLKKMTGPYGWTVNFSKLIHLPGNPSTIEKWIDYHESVSLLPVTEKFVFKMIEYGDFSVENLSAELGLSRLSTEYFLANAQIHLQELVSTNRR